MILLLLSVGLESLDLFFFGNPEVLGFRSIIPLRPNFFFAQIICGLGGQVESNLDLKADIYSTPNHWKTTTWLSLSTLNTPFSLLVSSRLSLFLFLTWVGVDVDAIYSYIFPSKAMYMLMLVSSAGPSYFLWLCWFICDSL